jgi:hypothetical protein
MQPQNMVAAAAENTVGGSTANLAFCFFKTRNLLVNSVEKTPSLRNGKNDDHTTIHASSALGVRLHSQPKPKCGSIDVFRGPPLQA